MAAKLFPLFASILLILLPRLSYAISSGFKDEKSKPFEFLKHLHGYQKGQKVQGLSELKKYLQTFGYLKKYPQTQNATQMDFDDLLERAIKSYQLNYHLNSTGTLDSATVTKMMMPRCGAPDVNTGRMSKQHNHGSNSSLHTVAHYSFFQGTPKWRDYKTHLTYAFLARADILGPPCARAFQKWASMTHFSFEEISSYNIADIKISFQIGDHGDDLGPFDGPHGILAHAYAPEDGRLHFDGQDLWSMSPTPGAYDLETVALHEIGHILGLDHSKVEDAIMYPILPFGEGKGVSSRGCYFSERSSYQRSPY
ncbi:hypothetical protein F0562_033686 [Nyssa sinensis]|uniref:Peptidase metallopeptidase domain-containing protein n=1 Tax=Nyssa sinensis TaxID=561372 RepID=A0A5J5AEP3_9ASTE|nr:hypothetical protein F0562_033686 [Nyssa sinensis]